MTSWLRQSTAQDVSVGPFLDETDGKTAETGLTITQPDIRIKKNGGAWAQKNAAQTLTHEENGWYEIALDATDTNTLGLLLVAVHEAGALPVWREFQVVPAQVWDSFFGADLLQVDATQWLGGAIATPTVTGVPEVDVTHAAGSVQASIATQASVNTIDDFLDTEIAAILAAVDTEVAAIKLKTDALPASPANEATSASILAAVDTEIPAILAAVDTEIASILAAVDTEVAAIKLKTDNLPVAPAAVGDIPTAAQNAAGLLDLVDAIETGITMRSALRVALAVLAGKVSGAGTGLELFRNVLADTKDRVSSTTDASGNRSAVVLDLT